MGEKKFKIEIQIFSDDDLRTEGPCAELRSRKPKLGGLAFRLKIANISGAQNSTPFFNAPVFQWQLGND